MARNSSEASHANVIISMNAASTSGQNQRYMPLGANLQGYSPFVKCRKVLVHIFLLKEKLNPLDIYSLYQLTLGEGHGTKYKLYKEQ